MTDEVRISTQLRLPEDLHDSLVAAADERGVSLNWLAIKLLTESLECLSPGMHLTLSQRPS